MTANFPDVPSVGKVIRTGAAAHDNVDVCIGVKDGESVRLKRDAPRRGAEKARKTRGRCRVQTHG